MGALGGWAIAFRAALDERFGVLAPIVAGAAAALAVAIAMAIYFRSGYRSSGDILRHGVATIVVLGLLAFVAYDVRHAAFDYLGINPSKPAVEFEIRLPRATALAAISSETQAIASEAQVIASETQVIASETQVELHTDKNQALARLDQRLSSTDEGRSILKGSVALDFRTSDRVVVLNLPGHTQGLFKLRLAANPSSSEQFGPWHLADRIASSSPTEAARRMPNDAFAIRYRVM
jgi:hypothetical protein